MFVRTCNASRMQVIFSSTDNNVYGLLFYCLDILIKPVIQHVLLLRGFFSNVVRRCLGRIIKTNGHYYIICHNAFHKCTNNDRHK